MLALITDFLLDKDISVFSAQRTHSALVFTTRVEEDLAKLVLSPVEIPVLGQFSFYPGTNPFALRLTISGLPFGCTPRVLRDALDSQIGRTSIIRCDMGVLSGLRSSATIYTNEATAIVCMPFRRVPQYVAILGVACDVRVHAPAAQFAKRTYASAAAPEMAASASTPVPPPPVPLASALDDTKSPPSGEAEDPEDALANANASDDADVATSQAQVNATKSMATTTSDDAMEVDYLSQSSSQMAALPTFSSDPPDDADSESEDTMGNKRAHPPTSPSASGSSVDGDSGLTLLDPLPDSSPAASLADEAQHDNKRARPSGTLAVSSSVTPAGDVGAP